MKFPDNVIETQTERWLYGIRGDDGQEFRVSHNNMTFFS